jgi:hypothetical protein
MIALLLSAVAIYASDCERITLDSLNQDNSSVDFSRKVKCLYESTQEASRVHSAVFKILSTKGQKFFEASADLVFNVYPDTEKLKGLVVGLVQYIAENYKENSYIDNLQKLHQASLSLINVPVRRILNGVIENASSWLSKSAIPATIINTVNTGVADPAAETQQFLLGILNERLQSVTQDVIDKQTKLVAYMTATQNNQETLQIIKSNLQAQLALLVKKPIN